MSTIDWAAFGPAALGISLIPGANQLLSLQNSYRNGPVAATTAVLGRFTAFAIMAVLVGLGLGAILVRSSVVFQTVKWAGVAYLLFLGAQSWYASFRRSEPGAAPPAAPAVHSTWSLTRREFTVAATNPKAILLFAAMLPQFVHGSGGLTANLILVGFAYIGVEAFSAVVYTMVGSRLRQLTITAERDRLLQRFTGTCMIGFGAYLAATARATS